MIGKYVNNVKRREKVPIVMNVGRKEEEALKIRRKEKTTLGRGEKRRERRQGYEKKQSCSSVRPKTPQCGIKFSWDSYKSGCTPVKFSTTPHQVDKLGRTRSSFVLPTNPNRQCPFSGPKGEKKKKGKKPGTR
jgi:hypothetical protein